MPGVAGSPLQRDGADPLTGVDDGEPVEVVGVGGGLQHEVVVAQVGGVGHEPEATRAMMESAS